ncbi:MAG: hypothetical protein L3K03_00005, partial [Thermoplasmata archaeon]|nr:hypothetical protein [Thermoplasmata archaeon]
MSTQYSSEVASLGAGYTFSFDGAGLNSTASLSTCTVTYLDYAVEYTVLNQSTGVSGQFFVFVNDASGAILGDSIEWNVDPAHGTGQYTGNTIYSNSRSATYTYGQWTNFGVSPNAAHCGATPVGLCKISTWTGLANSAKSDIVQSGFDASLWVVNVGWPFGYWLFGTYTPWYEFFPAGPQFAPWTASPGDTVLSFTIDNGGGWYYAMVYDVTSG